MAGYLLIGAKYIPADKYDWCPGGVAKTAAQILCECATLNRIGAAILRGEEAKDEGEAHATCCEATATHEKARDAIEASCAELCAAIALWDGKDLTQQLQMPWGMSMAAETVIWLGGSHMNYHNGQLNYIQALLGDAAMHWE
jgi:uncharacterized damage-inducible protein DinB